MKRVLTSVIAVFLFASLYSNGFEKYLTASYDNSFLTEAHSLNEISNEANLINGYSFPLQSKDILINSVKTYFTSSKKKQSLVYYEDGQKQVEGHILGGIDYNKIADDNYSIVYWGLAVTAKYKNLVIDGEWWKGHTSTNNEYSQESQLLNSWIQDEDNTIYIDKFKGEITYNIDDFGYISIKRNKLNIGSNIGGSIILSDENTNDYGFIDYSFNFGDFNLSFAHANLVCDSLSTGDPGSIDKEDAPDKYLALHTYSWSQSKKLKLFFGEQIYYGNKALDLNYFAPIGLWRIIEHNQGDRGNVLIFGGIESWINDNSYFYGNVIFDELSKSKIFTSWWGNKYAFQTGFIQNNIYDSDLVSLKSIGAEFTAVRPWMYTHKYLYSKASNDNETLGFPDGTNLIKYTLETNLSFFNNKIDYCLNTSLTRQGSVANNYTFNYEYEIDDIDGASASWLEGTITNKISIKNEVNFNFLYSHRVKVALEMVKEAEESFEKEIVISYQTRF